MANNLVAVINADTGKFVQNVKAAQYMLDKFVEEQKKSVNSSKANQTVTNEQVAAYQRVIKSLDKIASGTMKTKQQEKALADQIKELKIQWANLSDTAKSGDFGKSLSDSMQQASKQLKTIRKQLQQVGNEIDNTKNKAKGGFNFDFKSLKSFTSQGLGMVAGVGSIAAGVSLAIGALKDGVKTTMDFNKQQSILQAVTMQSKEQLKDLTDQALELGAKTRYSASEIAGLQIELAKLGFNPREIKEMTEHVQNLATALDSDLANSASLVGATLRMFGLETQDTQKVADVLAASCSKSALSFEFLNSAMSTVGPVANAFGLSLEDTVGILGVLANAGFDASSSATAAKNIFLNLADANGKLAQSFGKPVKSGQEMMTALKSLKDRGIDLATALEMTDRRSVAAFNTLLDGADNGKELIKALEGCNGAAKQMSDIMSDNLEGDLAGLNSAWEGLMLQLGGGQDLFREVVQWITKLVQKVTEVSKSISDWATDLYDNSVVVRGILKGLKWIFEDTFRAIKHIVTDAGEAISRICVAMGKALEGKWGEAVDALMGKWQRSKEKIEKEVKAPEAIQTEGGKKSATNAVNNKIGGGGKTKSKKTTVKVKVEAEDDTLDYWKDYLSKLQKKLTSKKLTPIDIDATKKQLEDAKAHVTDWENKINELRNRLDSNPLSPISIENVEKELGEATKNLNQWRQKLDELKKQSSITVSFDDTRKQVDNAKRNVGKWEKVIKDLNRRLENTNLSPIEAEKVLKQINGAEKHLKAWRERLKSLNNESTLNVSMEDTKKEIENAQRYITKWENKVNELSARLHQAPLTPIEVAQIKDNISDADKQLQTWKEKVNALSKELTVKVSMIDASKTQQEIDDATTQLETWKSKVDELRERLVTQSLSPVDAKKIEKELNTSLKQVDYWDKKLSSLKKELDIKVSMVDSKKVQDEITRVKKIIEKKEIELGIRAKEGSLESIEHQISEIDNQLKKLNPTFDSAEIEQLKVKKEALEDAKKQVEASLKSVTIVAKKFETQGKQGSLQEAQDRVTFYKNKLTLEVEGTEEFDYLTNKVKEWTEKEHNIRIGVESSLDNADKDSLKFLDNKISTLQTKLEVTAYGTPEYKAIKSELDGYTKKKQKIEYEISLDNKTGLQQFQDITDSFYGLDGVISSMESLQKAIDEGANAWQIFISVLNTVDSTLQALSSTIEAVNTIQKMLGDTTKATTAIQTAAATESSVNAATEVANATAVASAKGGEAIAGATASGAKLPFPLNLAAIAAGIAAVISALAMIGSFANGGIIQGQTTIGDYNLARVNKGEMILNGRQQNNLFKAIDENRLGGGGTVVGGEIKIKGSDLYIALKNYSKVQGKLGKNTGIL